MVHMFKLNGNKIAIDCASGAVHVLSELAYTMMKYIVPPMPKNCPSSLRYDLAKFDSNSVSEAYDELYELYRNGELFAEDFITDKNNKDTLKPEKVPIKAMCLHIAHDCNMRCRYCFASAGDFHRDRSLMSLETGKKALDFLMEKSGQIHNLEVDFFGGEPLMNFDVVKQLVLYGRETEKKFNKNIRFTITTNGSLLNNDSIAFINEHMSNVVLSIDGLKTTNDNMRTFEDGSGTYDTILPKYKALVDKRGDKDYYVRGTFTRENLHFADDVIHLANEGFTQISVEPVVLPSSDELSIREEDLPIIFKEYEKLAKEIINREKIGNPFNFFHFIIDLDAGPCVYKRTKGCGSGSEYVAVTPDGDIYPCHQFVEYTNYKLGNIYDNTFNREIQSCFACNNITTMEKCKICWAKYFCGGGCAANNYKFNQNTTEPYKIACELEKKRIECALMIKASLSK